MNRVRKVPTPGRLAVPDGSVKPLLREICHDPLLGLLAFVPVVFVAATLAPEAHTAHFALSVLAIPPLAALLSHAAKSIRLALATLAGATVLVALVSEIFVESVQTAAETFGMTPTFSAMPCRCVGLLRRAAAR